MLGLGFPKISRGTTSVVALPGHSPEASISAMVSCAMRFCSSLV